MIGNWPSAGSEKEAEESDAGDKRRTGMHEGETGPAQGASLGSLGVAFVAQPFPSPHYCTKERGEREGSVGHGPSQNRSPRFPAPTNTIIVIVTTTIIPRSLLRNAPHPSGVLRAVGAVPKHGSLQQQAGGKRAVRLGVSLAFFFFPSVRIPSAQQQKHRIVAYSQRCRGVGAGCCITPK